MISKKKNPITSGNHKTKSLERIFYKSTISKKIYGAQKIRIELIKRENKDLSHEKRYTNRLELERPVLDAF